MKHLELLLDSLLATAVIIQAVSTTHGLLTAHARNALKAFNHIVTGSQPPPATTPTPVSPRTAPTQSYAQAATHHDPATTAAHLTRAQPASLISRPLPAHTEKPKLVRQRQKPANTAQRLIIRWPGKPVVITPAALTSFVESLNGSLSPHRSVVGGVPPLPLVTGANLTRSGGIAIHVRAPFTAAELLTHRDTILETLDDEAREGMVDMDAIGDPLLELDVPWYGVVVHNVAGPPSVHAMEQEEGMFEPLRRDAGLLRKDIKDVRFLCTDAAWEANLESYSIRIMLEDEAVATRLCRDGTFLLGSLCRVSRYRPRKKTHLQTQGPP
ncbi:hypothetical protein GALMADRAFT_237202 [Galerina marginata CBS 339.88]|uniref:Uncharacterized protein n=1 Tax=Galerina marginata (strain CBS 339.88) TaxID=685588 RepID=A0A067TZ78_GALM3|nr:hypothetical protein GALMADRAFT_237202 [Galerina marginata CBS 339.88]